MTETIKEKTQGARVNKAWYFPETGNPDVLTETTLPFPEPGEGQLLIRVIASGFNPVDTKIRAGLAPIAADNHVPGCDLCGEVIGIGPGCRGFAEGDVVYGCAGGVKGSSGTLCQYIAVDAELVARAPATLSPEQVAALPLISITAFEALNRLNVSEGESLLILGGSGGVGQMALQLAQLRGAVVTATAGTGVRRDMVASFGATACAHDTDLEGFACVLDTHGGESFQRGLSAAATGGRLATVNARNTYDLALAHAKGLTIHAVFMLLPLLTGRGRSEHGRFLHWLAKAVDDGQIAAPETEVQPASAIAAVHRRYEESGLNTKVVFTF